MNLRPKKVYETTIQLKEEKLIFSTSARERIRLPASNKQGKVYGSEVDSLDKTEKPQKLRFQASISNLLPVA